MQQLEELFHEAVGLEPDERADFMARARISHPELAAAVESLIAAHEGPDSPIDSPAYEAAAEIIAGRQPALVPGQVVGHYQITALLGKGGMGEVYLASDTKLDRKVALKLLPAEFTNHKDRLRRFIQEARAASSLNHPNIITIHEIGQTEGAHFIATEFIDGHTLKHRMAHTRMELPDILDVSIQAASALQAAHAAGIIHRDVKPENIMLRPDGYVKVLDFGLAKLTEKSRQSQPTSADSEIDTMVKAGTKPGTLMGTVHYMSPEQARCQVLDSRTDVFSLGVVIYEMAAGRKAFAGPTDIDTLVSILEKDPVSLDECAPEVPVEFQRIISKTLRKNREERYQTIKDLLIDLKSFKEELSFALKLERSGPPRTSLEPVTTPAASEAVVTDQEAVTDQKAVVATADRPAQRSGSRNRRALMVVVLIVLLAVLAIVAVMWRRGGSTPAISTPATAVERTLSYWITVQKYRDGKPYQDPFRLRDDINFEKDYRIRLNITSSQSGRLYLLNEGPAGADQTPTFNVLFPSETANNGSALLTESQPIQIPQQSWFQFDEQQGTEKIWVVWAKKDVPEMEAVKGFANSKDRGVISSPGLRTGVNEFLKAHSTPSVSVKRDEEKKDTLVTANGEILVHVIKLEHH
ncbi:MAG: serine/threonine protein kinase [Pyrinomonadaceae bacterium]|nr:serine/threonine protein kinase [Pyrinomonadaceae bacterium]